jgi:hypothetical protein
MDKIDEIANDFCKWQITFIRGQRRSVIVFKAIEDTIGPRNLYDQFRQSLSYNITDEEFKEAIGRLVEADFFHSEMLKSNTYTFREESMALYGSYFAYIKGKNNKTGN